MWRRLASKPGNVRDSASTPHIFQGHITQTAPTSGVTHRNELQATGVKPWLSEYIDPCRDPVDATGADVSDLGA